MGIDTSKRSSNSMIMSMTVSESTVVPSQITVSPVIGVSPIWYGASWLRISRSTSIWRDTRSTLASMRSGEVCMRASQRTAAPMGNNNSLRRVATHFEILLLFDATSPFEWGGKESLRGERRRCDPLVEVAQRAGRQRLLALLAAQGAFYRRGESGSGGPRGGGCGQRRPRSV